MVKKVAAIICIVLAINLLITSCQKQALDHELSDLGGVYSSNMDDIDFSEEITGRLTEGNPAVEIYPETEISSHAVLNAGYSNKLLRWGLKRNSDNRPPSPDPGAPELLERYGGAYLGSTTEKRIYLTFDEGYENGYTSKILDVLRDNDVQALFFITGPYLKEHQDLVRRMVEEGHVVGNHTIHHPSLPDVKDDQLEEELLGLERAFKEKFGQSMRYLRPPKGEYSERTLAISQQLGYINLFWSFAYDDWYKDKIRGADYAYNKVIQNLHNGAVLLLHAVSKDNADGLDMIIKGVREKGYEFGKIDELDTWQSSEYKNN